MLSYLILFYKEMMSCIYLMLPEVCMFICVMLLFCYGISYYSLYEGKYLPSSETYYYLVSCICLCCVCLEINTPLYGTFYMFTKDSFSMFFSIVLLFISLFIFPISKAYFNNHSFSMFEYSFLFLMILFSSILLMQTYLLVLIYLFFELQNISLYILTAFYRNNGNSIESGLKYFILSSFSSTVMLFGIVLLYCYSGSLHLVDLQVLLVGMDLSSEHAYIEIGFSFLIFGLLFKLYCVPFHFWVSDIYHGAPTSTTLILACISYISTFCVFMNIFFTLTVTELLFIPAGQYYFVVVCLLLGGLGGMYQIQIKRLLAYSSISTVGYLLYGFFDATEVAVLDIVFFFVTYCFSLVGIFLIMFFIERKLSLDYSIECYTIEHFSGFYFINKYLCFFFGIFFFSLSGIPPYTGFFPKYFILDDSITFGESAIFFSMLVNSFCACFFYITFIKTLYYENPSFVLSCVNKRAYSLVNFGLILIIVLLCGILFMLISAEFIMVADPRDGSSWWQVISAFFSDSWQGIKKGIKEDGFFLYFIEVCIGISLCSLIFVFYVVIICACTFIACVWFYPLCVVCREGFFFIMWYCVEPGLKEIKLSYKIYLLLLYFALIYITIKACYAVSFLYWPFTYVCLFYTFCELIVAYVLPKSLTTEIVVRIRSIFFKTSFLHGLYIFYCECQYYVDLAFSLALFFFLSCSFLYILPLYSDTFYEWFNFCDDVKTIRPCW